VGKESEAITRRRSARRGAKLAKMKVAGGEGRRSGLDEVKRLTKRAAVPVTPKL
jgi:hypothetical protein